MVQASLVAFISQFLPTDPLCHELAAVNGLVTGLKVQKTGVLKVSCLVDKPIPVDLLCRTEEKLEQVLTLAEALIHQTYPSQLDAGTGSLYAAELQPWLLRHLWHRDALSASMLKQARFTAGADHVVIHLEEACRSVFSTESLESLQMCFSNHVTAQTRFCLAGDASDCDSDIADYARGLFSRHLARARQVHSAVNGDSAAGSPRQGNADNSPAENNRTLRDQPAGIQPDARRRYRVPKVEGLLWGRVNPDLKRVPIDSLNSETGLALIEGRVFDLETRLVSDGTRVLYKFSMTDLSSSISCILFSKPEERPFLEETLDHAYIRLAAEISFDGQFSKDLQARVTGLQKAEPQPQRTDDAVLKRVELHAHTKMSAKDAVCDARDLVRLAADFGHAAVAITDHGVVQAFPEAAEACADLKKAGKDIKVIYGMEGYLVDDLAAVAWQCEETSLEDGFVACDVETTGLDPALDRLIEVAAVHFVPDGTGGFLPGERLVSLVNPGIDVPPESVRLTGISTDMIAAAPDPLTVLHRLKEWIGDRPVVAHNAFFDLGFLRYEGQRTSTEQDPTLKFNPPLIDTLALSRLLLPDLSRHKLGAVADHLGIALDQAHRAEADALACGFVFSALWKKSGAATLNGLNRLAGQLDQEALLEHKLPVYHIILQAADRLGLYHLYRIVSQSHLQYFHMRPRIPRSLLQYFRNGLIVGSACESGELFQTVLQTYRAAGQSEEETLRRLNAPAGKALARFYDYFEIQPLANNAFYLRDPQSGLHDEDDLKALNRIIYRWGKKLKIPVCATCDVHFLEQRDTEFRRILMTDMGYADAAEQAPLYFRTTSEMLASFAWLGEEAAQEVVIQNPSLIGERVSGALKPFPDGSFPPLIDQAATDVRDLTWGQADAIYGCDGILPELVRQRIERELTSIIDNGFAVMYYIAHKLVKKSNEDGYIVGSRGSVGSSLVATLCGITEVNPLPPHYVCPGCHYSSFDETGNYGSGYDLPDRDCPRCGTTLAREGQDIPFETFLGFNGDKQPDIDLNFSGEYQARAHKYIEEMFGASHTYRAGTISSFADKNAQAIVRKYFEAEEQFTTQAEVSRLARGLIGVKRTTGQHPGGIVVVPREREICDFTPVQHPADKSSNGTITTHFDFNAMHDTILKLDILGHDDPTMLKMLSDLTRVPVATIPMPDERVMSLFQSTEALDIPVEQAIDGCATLGLPEMGTFMAREMIRETRPTRFYDLVQLMGLSHGTDVWKGNAQDLIRSGTCTIEEVIGCRDSIMTGLIYNGLPPKAAFDIMEKVRKGKGLTEEQENLMREHQVPEWYIESCKKIRYMFPKAHAAAYTISSLRIAWFKVNHPEAYYCAYFTVRADEFDSRVMCRPAAEIHRVREKMRRELRDGGDREQRIYYIMELVEEMQLRGIDFAPISLEASDATKFVTLAPGLILPPLNAVPSVSVATAAQIVQARADGPFKTRDDLARRASLGQSVIDNLAEAGCLADLPESSQINLFELMEQERE